MKLASFVYLLNVANAKLGTRLQFSSTPREWEVARLVARGLGNKEIARMLGTTPSTVKVQVHSVLKKLGASKRSDLLLQRS